MIEFNTAPSVDILAYCLMGNHYHLLVEQRTNGGISDFMQRLGCGYTMYFNKRYERTGRLFESTFRAKPVRTPDAVRIVSRYIHLNPLELIEPEWKKSGVRDWETAGRFVNTYRWSSMKNYAATAHESFIVTKPVLDLFRDRAEYLGFVRGWATREDAAVWGEDLPRTGQGLALAGSRLNLGLEMAKVSGVG